MAWTENTSLKNYNTFGIEARARYFAIFSTTEELASLLGQAARPPLILGGGSNILLTGDVDGWVLINGIRGIDLVDEDDRYFYVQAGAGENWQVSSNIALTATGPASRTFPSSPAASERRPCKTSALMASN